MACTLVDSRHCPPSVYPLSTWHYHMWLYLPGRPSPFLHNASDPKLELGKAWEQSYVITMYAALLLTLILFPDWGCCWRFRNLIITASNSLLCCYMPFPSLPFYPTISFILFTSSAFCLFFPSLLSLHFPPTFSAPLPFSHFLLTIVISCWKPSFLVHAHTLIHTEQFKQKVLICDEPSTSSQSSWSVMSACTVSMLLMCGKILYTIFCWICC